MQKMDALMLSRVVGAHKQLDTYITNSSHKAEAVDGRASLSFKDTSQVCVFLCKSQESFLLLSLSDGGGRRLLGQYFP